jgi:hypothetical protein
LPNASKDMNDISTFRWGRMVPPSELVEMCPSLVNKLSVNMWNRQSGGCVVSSSLPDSTVISILVEEIVHFTGLSFTV